MPRLTLDPDTLTDDDAWALAVTEGFFVEDRGVNGWAWGVAGRVYGDSFATLADAKAAGVGEWRDWHAEDWCPTCGPDGRCPECRGA